MVACMHASLQPARMEPSFPVLNRIVWCCCHAASPMASMIPGLPAQCSPTRWVPAACWAKEAFQCNKPLGRGAAPVRPAGHSIASCTARRPPSARPAGRSEHLALTLACATIAAACIVITSACASTAAVAATPAAAQAWRVPAIMTPKASHRQDLSA